MEDLLDCETLTSPKQEDEEIPYEAPNALIFLITLEHGLSPRGLTKEDILRHSNLNQTDVIEARFLRIKKGEIIKFYLVLCPEIDRMIVRQKVDRTSSTDHHFSIRAFLAEQISSNTKKESFYSLVIQKVDSNEEDTAAIFSAFRLGGDSKKTKSENPNQLMGVIHEMREETKLSKFHMRNLSSDEEDLPQSENSLDLLPPAPFNHEVQYQDGYTVPPPYFMFPHSQMHQYSSISNPGTFGTLELPKSSHMDACSTKSYMSNSVFSYNSMPESTFSDTSKGVTVLVRDINNVTAKQIFNLFSNFGNISKILHSMSAKWCLVEYKNLASATLAKRMLEGVSLFGSELKVEYRLD